MMKRRRRIIPITNLLVLLLLLLLFTSLKAEDRPREYREGAYCKDISYVDTSMDGVEGSLKCEEGASVGLCVRHASCIKKDGLAEEKSGCQSKYIRDALGDTKGIHSLESCQLYCSEIRPDLPVVSYRRSEKNKICCACSSTGIPGQYCHKEVKCIIGASFCCEGSNAASLSLSLTTITMIIFMGIN